MYDHVQIAVSDLAASERFYRTVLSVLGVEPSRADSELVEWEDWDVGRTNGEHPVSRGLHVGFRAPDPASVDAFSSPSGSTPVTRVTAHPGRARPTALTTTAPSCSIPTATASKPSTPTAIAPYPTAASTTCGSASVTRRRRGASTRRSGPTPGFASHTTSRIACGSPAPTSPSRSCATSPADRARPHRLPRRRGRHRAGVPRRRARPLATKTTAPPASAPCTTRATTAPSCSIRTATTSRSSTTTVEPCRPASFAAT